MQQTFAQMLAVGGKANSLGIAQEVVEIVLQDKTRLEDLYVCTFHEDAWVRMRAIDSIEKICRDHPDWLLPYVDRLLSDHTSSEQASIRWHLAQIYRQVELTGEQRRHVTSWLRHLLSTKDVDWIVSVNAMNTLAQFTRKDVYSIGDLIPLLEIQQGHTSNAVSRRAKKLLLELTAK